MNVVASLVLVSLLGFLVLGLLALIVLAFEVWMFVDMLRNQGISSKRRILWAIGMLVLHPFVAITYYFTDRLEV